MLPKPTPFEPNPFRIPPEDLSVRPKPRATAPSANGASKSHRINPVPDSPTAAGPPSAADPPSPDQKSIALARRGPPVVFDEERRWLFCDLIRHGFTKAKAARLLGFAPRTVQEAAQNDPDFAEWVREANLELHAHSAANIARAGKQNWRAAAWLLDRAKLRRGPGRPSTRALLLTDPLLRLEMKQLVKQLVREVLLEVMPELRREIIAPPASIAPSPSAIRHFPRASAQTKSRQFPHDIPDHASQLPLPQTLAPPHANGHARITAHNP